MFDVPVFTEKDSSFFADIASTKDGKFITVNSNSRTSSEEGTCLSHFNFLMCLKMSSPCILNLSGSIQVYTIDASNPQDGLRRLRKRVPGVKYFVEHHSGFFYILTNASLSEDKELSTGNYYLGRLRVEDTHLDNWQVNFIFFCASFLFDVGACVGKRSIYLTEM